MQSWNAIAVFCEDIRQEASGQMTIIGIFSDNLAIQKVPALFPRLGVYFRIHLAVDADIRNISTKLRLPDGQTMEIGNFAHDFIKKTQEDSKQKGAPLAGFISRGWGQMSIGTPGRILAIANIDDVELTCGSLNIVKAD